jgi:tetratricopeptide (TPR) repeat protein
MAAAGTNPKIEELRFKLKADPKSRLFYPLAEELRKIGQPAEAEQVLRAGLTTHATYLSAWVVLGRVLREQGKHADAVAALSQALNLDRGNVVAARLLAESYLALGEKVEAIKKYKLVAALMPGDEETEAIIHRLQGEISGIAVSPVSVASPEPSPPESAPAPTPPPPPAATTAPVRVEPPPPAEPDAEPFEITYSRLQKERETQSRTGDAEPMGAEHEQSPFEEPAGDAGYSADAFAIEEPAGMHLAAPPLGSELAEPFPPEALPPETSPVSPAEPEEADLYEPVEEVAPGFIQGRFEANVPPPPAASDDFAKTITMADLYANQGLIDEARDIYEDVLARDPDNAVVRAKLEALEAQDAPEAEPMEEESVWGRETEPVPLADMPADDDEPTLELRMPPDAEIAPEAPQPAAAPASSEEALPPETPKPSPKVEKLESWLSKVKRPGVGSV